nr:DEAD/DEAH box helicase [Streptomyces sp. 846.5]
MTLPVALSGHDVIGQAKTGTGKTLGFGLPIIDRVRVLADVDAGRTTAAELPSSPQALVVVPTRELCTQVTNDLQTAGKVRNVRVLAIYGGRAYEPQVEALQKGVDVVVGTPGRLLDLARQRKLDLSAVRCLVLDEADEMLDLGFLPDVEKIMTMLPAKRQTMLFSATMPGQVISLARRYMSQPTHIRAAAPDDTGATVASVKQHIFRAHSLDKVELVSRILQSEGRGLAMIFCRTKRTAADVADQLTQRGFAAGAVHGDLGQGAREQALRAFRNGKVDVLVCTDVAARGIDVEGVTHVMNYQCPEDEKTYLHRIGRTGRAGASGTAVTLVDWDDMPRWALINKALDLGLGEPEETYSTSPHLYELLHIAPGTKGVLPRADRTRAGLGAEAIEDLGEPGGGRKSADRGAAGRGGRDAGGRGPARGDSRRPAAEAPAPAEEPRPRRERSRRRTRGGAADAVGQVVETTESTAAPVTAVAETPAEETAERRRRRRGGKAAEALETVETLAGTASVVEEPVAQAPVAEQPAAEAPAPRTRRRRTTAAAETPAVDTLETVAEAPAAVVEEAAPRRRRSTAKAAVETAAEAPAEAPAEAEATAPRRRRRSAVSAEVPAEAVATAVETAPEVVAETPAPRRRRSTAKAAATVVEAAAAAVEVSGTVAAEAPAPRTRRRAARPAGAAEVPTPAEVPAPRRRTPAATSPVPATATEEITPQRRRRRSERLADAAAAAAAAEAAGLR